ncbi:unnamed protein product [Sympodiomycopsis kandeliae]
MALVASRALRQVASPRPPPSVIRQFHSSLSLSQNQDQTHRKTNQQERAIRLAESSKRKKRRATQTVQTDVGDGKSFARSSQSQRQRPKSPNTSPRRGRANDQFVSKATSALQAIRKDVKMGNSDLNLLWDKAQAVVDSFNSPSLQENAVLVNQLLDIAFQCDKAKEARDIFLGMKKQGVCPTLITFITVLTGILKKEPGPNDVTLRAWAQSCYREVESLRQDALGSVPKDQRETEHLSDEAGEQLLESTSKYQRSRANIIRSIQRDPQQLSKVYATYVAYCLTMGDQEQAWQIMDRTGTNLFEAERSFPCIDMHMTGKWIANSAIGGDPLGQIDPELYERTWLICQKWLEAMKRNRDELWQRYQANADDPQVQGKIAKRWQDMIPATRHLANLSLAASRCENVEFQKLILEVLREMTTFDLGKGKAKGAEQNQCCISFWDGQEAFRDPRHPLCSLVPFTRQDYSLGSQQSGQNSISRSVYFLATSLRNFTIPDEPVNDYHLEVHLTIADQELEAVRQSREKELLGPEKDGRRRNRSHTSLDSSLNYRSFLDRRVETAVALQHLMKSSNSIPQRLRLISTLRELHRAELIPEPLDSGHYALALRGVNWEDTRSVQLCKWWMEDVHAAAAEDKSSIWQDPNVIRNSLTFAMSTIRAIFGGGSSTSPSSPTEESQSLPELESIRESVNALKGNEEADVDLDVDLDVDIDSSTSLENLPVQDMSISRDQLIRAMETFSTTFQNTFPTKSDIDVIGDDNEFTKRIALNMARAFVQMSNLTLETSEWKLGPLKKEQVSFLKEFRRKANTLKLELLNGNSNSGGGGGGSKSDS